MTARSSSASTLFVLLAACRSPSPAKVPEDEGTNILAPPPRSSAPLPPVASAPPVPLRPSDDVHCTRDSECLVSTFAECCGAALAHGARKDVERAHERECDSMRAIAQCIDFDNLQELTIAKDFVARCVAGICSIEPKKQ